MIVLAVIVVCVLAVALLLAWLEADGARRIGSEWERRGLVQRRRRR